MLAPKITQAPSVEPVAAEMIAQSIIKIAEAFECINRSGLSKKAILLLLSHSSGVCQRDVLRVLQSINSLKQDYLAKSKAGK